MIFCLIQASAFTSKNERELLFGDKDLFGDLSRIGRDAAGSGWESSLEYGNHGAAVETYNFF